MKNSLPLHYAVLKGDITLLKEELEKGAPVDQNDEFGDTALHFAIVTLADADKRYEVCKMLLDHGADVNYRNEDGMTPLFYLSTQDESEVNDHGKLFDLLLEKGADLDCVDRFGNKPLPGAVKRNKLITVRKLLELGVKTGEDDLLTAIMESNEEMVKLLLNYGGYYPERDYSFIRAAVEKEQARILLLLYGYGARLGCDNDTRCITEDGEAETICRLLRSTISVHEFMDSLHLEEVLDTINAMMENSLDMEIYNKCHIDPCLLGYVQVRRTFYSRELRCNVLKHVAVLIETNHRQIAQASSRLIAENQLINEKYEEYMKQIQIMKTSVVRENREFTYFDLMTRKGKSLVRCCDPATIASVSRKKLQEFPDFADKLIRNVEIGVLQRAPIEFQPILHDILGSILPLEITNYICDYLHVRDLRVFRHRNVDSEIQD